MKKFNIFSLDSNQYFIFKISIIPSIIYIIIGSLYLLSLTFKTIPQIKKKIIKDCKRYNIK